MKFEPPEVLRCFSDATFPLKPDWHATRQRWHACYPPSVPPGLEFDPLRVEQLLLCALDRYPTNIAVEYYATRWTYAELTQRVRQAAANLRHLGVETGQRVLLVLPNCPEFVLSWFALHWLGAEVVPASPLLPAKDLVRLARLTQARCALGLDLRLAPVLEAARKAPLPMLIVASLAPHLPISLRWPYRLRCWLQSGPYLLPQTEIYDFSDLLKTAQRPLAAPVLADASLPAVLQPTGGTTGTPKVAVLTHRNLQANVAQLHVWSGLRPGTESVLGVLPFFHVFGATVGMLSAVAGGSRLLLQANFNPGRVWKLMDRLQGGVAPMVPFMFAALNQEMRKRGRNLRGLRFCFSGAAPLPADVLDEFQERTGAVVVEGYGLSEASPVTHTNPPDGNARKGTIGLPLPATEARIVDGEAGRTVLPPGQVGELIIRGPQVMAGYLDDPAETAHVLRDGWLHTGDLARMDNDGFFTLVDRKKDMIISGGLNVYPAEVEEVLASHPGVRACAVVGVPHPLYGEQVAAYIVPAGGRAVSFAELQAYCRPRLAAYKIPRRIEVVDHLPTNFLGKVRRAELRARAA